MIIASLVMLTPTVMAYDQDNPAVFTVNFETQEALTTTFSVNTNTVQLNFSALPGDTGVVPEGDNPWGNITNDANQALDFTPVW